EIVGDDSRDLRGPISLPDIERIDAVVTEVRALREESRIHISRTERYAEEAKRRALLRACKGDHRVRSRNPADARRSERAAVDRDQQTQIRACVYCVDLEECSRNEAAVP